MNYWRSIFLTGAGLLGIVSCLAACKRTNPDVLARVGDREILVSEFVKRFESRRSGSPVPIDSQSLLDELVLREVLVQSARRAGVESDSDVQELIRDVLISKLKERQLSPKIEAATVSDAEVKSAYEARRQSYTTPERVRLGMLFLRPKADSGDAGEMEVRRRFEAAQSQLRQMNVPSEGGFGPLAVSFSEDQETRYRGGDIGWVEQERFPKRIEGKLIETGFSLKEIGDVSEVIRGEHGFYLVRLLGRSEPTVLPLEKVEPEIRTSLLQAKQRQIEETFVADLRNTLRVEVHPDRIPSSATERIKAANLPPRLP